MHNRKKYYLFFLFLFNLLKFNLFFCFQKAVIQVPIADLIDTLLQDVTGEKIGNFYKNLSIKEHSPRLHQALFHEIVTVLEYNGTQAHILLENIFFNSDSKKHNDFWIMAKNILPLKKIITAGSEDKLPPSISFKDLNEYKTEKVITLKEPWYDTKTAKTYSAGTRFMQSCKASQDDQNYQVYILHAPTKTIITTFIAKNLCVPKRRLTEKEKIDLFVHILINWATEVEVIPYVWGGSSFVHRYPIELFSVKKNHASIIPTIKTNPKTGFDCSGLVARAAQIAGIPFFYKNTSTIASYLQPIKVSENILNGDIIWIPGHVMVVSNVSKNMLIEAGSYAYGYGFVHEIPLQKQFKGIKNYNDLKNAFINKKPLIRLCFDGTERQKIKEFKILKLRSAWQLLNNSSKTDKK